VWNTSIPARGLQLVKAAVFVYIGGLLVVVWNTSIPARGLQLNQRVGYPDADALEPGVKHLNPRQGITTPDGNCWHCKPPVFVWNTSIPARGLQLFGSSPRCPGRSGACVWNTSIPARGLQLVLHGYADSNSGDVVDVWNTSIPARGLQRLNELLGVGELLIRCETPKSPPGDYNFPNAADAFAVELDVLCETPQSPPGDYNELSSSQTPPIRSPSNVWNT
jgi:hypothetical protein